MNQTAQNLASRGRYGDTMLVHMSPQEVGGLQALARNNGTSLTVNPHTGLPEAFNLKSLLPLVAGVALGPAGLGLSALQAGLVTGGLGALATGSLKEGLMMGLGAAGGAGLAGSAASLAAPAAAAPAAQAAALPMPDPSMFAGAPVTPAAMPLPALGEGIAAAPGAVMPEALPVMSAGEVYGAAPAAQPAWTSGYDLPMGAQGPGSLSQGLSKVFESPESIGKFASQNKMNLAMAAAPGLMPGERPPMPGSGAYIRPYTMGVENLSNAPISPEGLEQERIRYRYIAGEPYRAAQGGIVAFAQGGNTIDGQELDQNPTLPPQPNMQMPPLARLDGYAAGGQAKYRDVRKKIDPMADPYKFADSRSSRGLYAAAQDNFANGGLSGVPRFLSGGGDGMSDSIPASINDRQPARLADGEFVIPADVVSHLGNGSSKAGAKQLYAMMDRARQKRTGKKQQAPAMNPKQVMPA